MSIPALRERSSYYSPVQSATSGASATTSVPARLARAEGAVFFDAYEAILKGVLESQVAVSVVAAPRRAPFERLQRFANEPEHARVLARHQVELLIGGDAARAISLACAGVRGGRSAIALVPNDELVRGADAVLRSTECFVHPDAGLALLFEDDPIRVPGCCPRRIALGAGLPTIEPTDISSLRSSIEWALRLSRAAGKPAAVIMHRAILQSADTIEARPNRVHGSVDEMILSRRQRHGPRAGEALDLVRMARRLEIDQLSALPSPGERDFVGFLTVGPCDRALMHLLDEFGLVGRVPVLRLGLISPVDDSILTRFLDRVQHAVVLEPRPGSVVPSVIEVAEIIRRRGNRTAKLWWTDMPAQDDGEVFDLRPGDSLHPSLLVRKILHLLHQARPHAQLGQRLASQRGMLESIKLPVRTPEGSDAETLLREQFAALDQELRSEAGSSDSDEPPTVLALDELPSLGAAARTVICELWKRARFIEEGAASMLQASRDPAPRIIAVLDIASATDPDLERLASAAVPANAADRVTIERVSLKDPQTVLDRLRTAAYRNGVSVLLFHGMDARGGAAIAEADRLGYPPQQRLVWNADLACELRPPLALHRIEQGLERGATPLQGEFTKSDVPRVPGLVRLTMQTLLEQVEVVRTKAPWSAVARLGGRLPTPRPLHAEQGIWRAHCAGIRAIGESGVADILADAGRAMGYRVEVGWDRSLVGLGRMAWAQVTFTRFRATDTRPPCAGTIPYGEADLVLGVDAVEALRALGPDPLLRVADSHRTAIVANDGALEDQLDQESIRRCALLFNAAQISCMPTRRVIGDLASRARNELLSERLLDVALLGLAYQRGFIPVTIEAIEGAMHAFEARGFGRSFEAFCFGRSLAEDTSTARRMTEERESVSGVISRLTFELVRERFGGRRRAKRFRRHATELVDRLKATRAGAMDEATIRLAVTALHRTLVWGGSRALFQYEELLGALIDADPDGRLACAAAEPLAEAMLPRDIFYVLSMTTSLEQRRRIRERLVVRGSNGDQMERRYLNRIDLAMGTRRYRLDFRSNDWPAEIVRLLRPLVPWTLRGDARDRAIRAWSIDFARRVAANFKADPRLWLARMEQFAALSREGGIRGMDPIELRIAVEGL